MRTALEEVQLFIFDRNEALSETTKLLWPLFNSFYYSQRVTFSPFQNFLRLSCHCILDFPVQLLSCFKQLSILSNHQIIKKSYTEYYVLIYPTRFKSTIKKNNIRKFEFLNFCYLSTYSMNVWSQSVLRGAERALFIFLSFFICISRNRKHFRVINKFYYTFSYP